MSSKCPYPCCPGLPVALLQTCGNELCTNQLHHMCQTTTEYNNKIDDGLKKRCYECLKPLIKSNKTKENEEVDQDKEPSVDEPLIPPSSPPSNGNQSSKSSKSKDQPLITIPNSHGGKKL